METGLKHPRLFPVLDRLSTYSYIKPGHTRSSSMEHSSPLAAMQPSSLPFGPWGCRNDVPLSYPNYGGQYGGKLGFGPSSFDFKDLSMTKAPADYFNLKSVRGSSPTTTLAADLSQNFHIDQRYAYRLRSIQLFEALILTFTSPQLPTPRRSLFSQNLFGTINGRGRTTSRNIGLRDFDLRWNRASDYAAASFFLTRTWKRFYGHIPIATQSTIRCSSNSCISNTGNHTHKWTQFIPSKRQPGSIDRSFEAACSVRVSVLSPNH